MAYWDYTLSNWATQSGPEFYIIYAADDVTRTISSVETWKQKAYNKRLSIGKLNKTVFNYVPLLFHFGNKNPSEYLRQSDVILRMFTWVMELLKKQTGDNETTQISNLKNCFGWRVEKQRWGYWSPETRVYWRKLESILLRPRSTEEKHCCWKWPIGRWRKWELPFTSLPTDKSSHWQTTVEASCLRNLGEIFLLESVSMWYKMEKEEENIWGQVEEQLTQMFENLPTL